VSQGEAQRIARTRAQELQALGYDELCRRFGGEAASETVVGESGTPYEVDIEASVSESGELRVVVIVDDETGSTFDPHSEAFFVDPR
jgi:hypothetical protein